MDTPRGDRVSVGSAEGRVVTRGHPVADPPVRTVLDTDTRPRFAWHGAAEDVVVRGAAATVAADGPNRFATVRDRAQELLEGADVAPELPVAARPRLFGGFAFNAGQAIDSRWDGFDDATFILPAVQLTRTEDGWWLTATATGPGADRVAEDRLGEWSDRLETMRESDSPGRNGRDGSTFTPPGIVDRTATPSAEGWRRQVTDALAAVEDGILEKVVLAQALDVTLAGDLSVPGALAALGEAYPECARFAVSPPGGGTFFGATPELLVSLRGRTVETEALAGSTGRGDTDEEDEWLARELRNSAKDAHEHRVVVEAIREQLEPLAATVTAGERSVRRLATVQHLRTPITAELATDEHVLSLVEALHPTPAVGGIPPDAALRTIDETETFDRGWYAAPVGWFDAAGDGTFAVAIRSAVARERSATLFAGAGIVGDSDPDAELDELRLKYRPVLDVLR